MSHQLSYQIYEDYETQLDLPMNTTASSVQNNDNRKVDLNAIENNNDGIPENLRIFPHNTSDPIISNQRHFPRGWGWRRVRPWVPIRRPNAFSDEQIELIAQHDVVMLEKSNGYKVFGSTEKGSLEAAKRIKAAKNVKRVRGKSRVKILFYLNAMVHYKGYEANNSFDLSWAATNRNTGEFVTWNSGQLSYDHTNLEFREWWINRALEMMSYDEIDGIFIDAICKTTKGYLPQGHAEAYFATANELRQRMPKGKLLIGNALRATETNLNSVGGDGNIKHLQYLDGSYLEQWDRNDEGMVKTLELMSAALKQNRMIMLSSTPFSGYQPHHYTKELIDAKRKLDSMESVDERYKFIEKFIEFPLGFFLLVVEPHAYFSYHYGVNADPHPRGRAAFDNNRFEEITRVLGLPDGPYVKEEEFVFTREFRHLKVWVDVKAKKGKLTTKKFLRNNDSEL